MALAKLISGRDDELILVRLRDVSAVAINGEHAEEGPTLVVMFTNGEVVKVPMDTRDRAIEVIAQVHAAMQGLREG